MDLIQALVLGVVQGVTEFLPISSDGHLALVYALFNQQPNLAYEILLHGATLLAMLIFFSSDIGRLLGALVPPYTAERAGDRRLVAIIAVGTIVTGLIAMLLSPVVEPLSADLRWVGVFFLLTAAALFVAEALADRVGHLSEPASLPWPKTAFIAVMQGLAVLPGLSRSGTTIAGGMLAGLSREHAARFSFLLGIPIIAVASAKDLVDIVGGNGHLPSLAVSSAGFVAAGLSGYFAISYLLGFVKSHRLTGFAIYVVVLGTVVLGWGIVGH